MTSPCRPGFIFRSENLHDLNHSCDDYDQEKDGDDDRRNRAHERTLARTALERISRLRSRQRELFNKRALSEFAFPLWLPTP